MKSIDIKLRTYKVPEHILSPEVVRLFGDDELQRHLSAQIEQAAMAWAERTERLFMGDEPKSNAGD